MDIQSYSANKAREIADLFYQSVHAIDSSVYTAEQKEAWAPTPIDYERWSERLNTKKPFIAVVENRVAGFIELDADGHMDQCVAGLEYGQIGAWALAAKQEPGTELWNAHIVLRGPGLATAVRRQAMTQSTEPPRYVIRMPGGVGGEEL
jgi:hypothetical protein